MKKETIIAILGTIIVIFVALVVYGVSVQNNEVASTKSTSYLLEQSFFDGCTESASVVECICAYDVIINKYGESEFLDIALDYERTGMIPDELFESTLNCF